MIQAQPELDFDAPPPAAGGLAELLQILKSQGRKMLKKWVRYQRRWHKRFKSREIAAGDG